MYWNILITILSVLGVGGMISGFVLFRLNKMDAKQDQREEARVRENILMFQGLDAAGGLAKATAIAVRDGKVNGELEKALENHNTYKKAKNSFLVEQNARYNHQS